MNNHAKGYRHEKEAREYLEANKWLTDIKNWSKWSNKDFFNMFDIVAIRKDVVRFIQVKSNTSDFYTARKEVKKWMKDNQLRLNCEVWLKENRKEWRKEVIMLDND